MIKCLIIVSVYCFNITGLKSQVEKNNTFLTEFEQSSSDYKLESIRQLTVLSQGTEGLLEVSANLEKEALEKPYVLMSSASLYKDNEPLQTMLLSKDSEIQKATSQLLKYKADLNRSRDVIIGLTLVLLLLVVFSFLAIHNSIKNKKKNIILRKQLEERFDFNKSQRKVVTLFDKVEKCMNEYKLYKTTDLSRDIVAKELSTNRQYLTDAIREATGKTFLDYVNFYRLNYAYNELLSDESVPVIDILYDAGFSSSSTFYRLFKAEFGMSPNELRNKRAEIA